MNRERLPVPPIPAAGLSGPEGEGVDHQDYGLLMSLALDGLLSSTEQADLTDHLGHCSACARLWHVWARVHETLEQAPMIMPRSGFVSRFEVRLLHQERRRKLWLGLFFGMATVTLWSGILMAGMIVTALVMANDGQGMAAMTGLTNLVQGAPAWLNAIRQGVVVTLSNTDVPWLLCAYAMVAMAILVGWTSYLRRTLRPVSLGSMPPTQLP